MLKHCFVYILKFFGLKSKKRLYENIVLDFGGSFFVRMLPVLLLFKYIKIDERNAFFRII